ncbi:MAG: DUF2795 domain-containing protein [Chloroflexi bacterium]|nr:DUF2795 domain-containing protein [Chloroflexota bacterium]MDA1002228.1 DUF2795 domain-containing protein [Chloroflexota bacterium]
MPQTPHASKQDYEAAFAGFHYPISKSAVLNGGRDKGGLDREVARVLTRIPDRKYRTVDELKDAVRGVYRAMGVPEDGLPV